MTWFFKCQTINARSETEWPIYLLINMAIVWTEKKNHLDKKLNKAADCSFTTNVKISSSGTIFLGGKLEPELMIGQIEMNISTNQISHSGLFFIFSILINLFLLQPRQFFLSSPPRPLCFCSGKGRSPWVSTNHGISGCIKTKHLPMWAKWPNMSPKSL